MGLDSFVLGGFGFSELDSRVSGSECYAQSL